MRYLVPLTPEPSPASNIDCDEFFLIMKGKRFFFGIPGIVHFHNIAPDIFIQMSFVSPQKVSPRPSSIDAPKAIIKHF